MEARIEPQRQLGFLWGAVALATVALAPLGPFIARALPGCPLKTLTGIPCPACGSGRAALALARLDVLGALRLNPLLALAMIAFVVGGAWAGITALRGGSLREPRRWPAWFRRTLWVAIVLNWVWLLIDGR